ncbi:MAG: cytochrome-c oxidase, cbb3-type subunit III, partial [Rhodospirillales bacterium]|nr:cytochrome-c oxidase, cbb3-type subunit III [Rhodospirillales bacterium]
MVIQPEKDEISGRETTGHEWDGIKELNNPLPRWWLWVFYATVVWAVGYVIAMPAIPLLGGYSKGVLGYSSRQELADEMSAVKESRADLRARIASTDLAGIRASADLLRFAIAGGRSAFAVNCVQCHGSGATGSKGYPNLNDDDWLWGGKIAEIEQTIRFGARSISEKGRQGNMPPFAGVLKPNEISAVADYARSLSGLKPEPEAG